MTEEVYLIEGMSCAACSSAVERVTGRLDGVERSEVNLATGKLTISYDEAKVTPDLIMQKVKKAGYGAIPFSAAKEHTVQQEQEPEQDPEAADLLRRKRDLISAAVFTVLLLYISMGHMLPYPLPLPNMLSAMHNPVNFALTQLLLTIPIYYFGRGFFTSGFMALYHLGPNMDSLIAIGSGFAFLYSLIITYMISSAPEHVHELYFESGATVITLVMLGKYLEAKSKGKTKNAIKKLMELAPKTAFLFENGAIREVSVESLKPGDTVIIKAGTSAPADGTVTGGAGSINESMLTGESLPVEKSEGSNITGGSVSYSGTLYVRIDRVGSDTMLSQIIKLVEDAQGKKAPVSRLADRVAGFFVPVVIVIALLSVAVWLMLGQDIGFILRIFTSVLVIACPCALGLATPTAIMVGTGLGASNGILIRSGAALEAAHKISAVVFDKTGTITSGTPAVSSMTTYNCSEEELLSLAASAETMSDHPLARAIVTRAKDLPLIGIDNFEDITGKGIKAKLKDGRNIAIGNSRLFAELGISTIVSENEVASFASRGQTPVFVALEEKLIGLIGIADPVRETSAGAVQALKKMGIRVFILTGDNRRTAEHIGRLVNADEVIAEVLPAGKVDVIKKLQDDGYSVMMVGDGVNDAPALAQADIGTAIGAGSDIAVSAGEIVLMRSDLVDVSRAVTLSRLTMRNIKQNLFWAFFYNIIGIPIAAGILYPFTGLLLSPIIAGFAMSLSSVSVVTNALRLRSKKL